MLLSGVYASSQTPVYMDESRPLDERVEDALSRMTLKEKVAIIHAQSKFSSPGVPRLGIPELWCTDGPHGVRPEVMWDEWEQAGWTNDSCTAYPALICLSASWDPELSYLYGKSIAEEACFRNKDVLLGPGVNIFRTPLCGRNFEYFGEDPCLTTEMSLPYIKGVQDNGVAVCVKHFALNNNELNRHTSNPVVDDRALHEIYFPAFKAAATRGDAWSFMGGYNLFRGEHASYNPYLMNEVLKGEWNYGGAVISDWGAVHDTPSAVNGGLDMEFGSWTDGLKAGQKNAYDNYWLANNYLVGLQDGTYGEDVLNDKVRRVLKLTMRTAMNRNRPWGEMVSDAHRQSCRQIGAGGIVLLKNDKGLLPVNPAKHRKIAIIGENAIKMMVVGGGSSSLKAKYEITPLEGLKARFGKVADIVYARGYVGDVSGEYNGVTTGQDLTDSRSKEELLAEAVGCAKSADLVIFIGGLNKSPHQDSEDTDRLDYNLPYGQNELIETLYDANPNLVVVNVAGTGVAMPWAKKVPAIVQAWYGGSEAGNAIADVLSGDVNPSGKMPYTLYATLDQCGAHRLGDYPGTKTTDRFGNEMWDIPYKEGIYVGYRFTEKNNLKPTFPFGHGLSYTTFGYGKAVLDKTEMEKDGTLKLTVLVTNTGSVAGKEVVQLYVRDVKASLDRPVKELNGFSNLEIAPGATAIAEFEITSDMLSFYNPASKSWEAEPGTFELLVGSSSADIRSKAKFTLK